MKIILLHRCFYFLLMLLRFLLLSANGAYGLDAKEESHGNGTECRSTMLAWLDLRELGLVSIDYGAEKHKCCEKMGFPNGTD